MVNQGTVLVLTQQLDFTADLVIAELNRRRVNVIRYDTSDFPLNSTLVACAGERAWKGSLDFQQRSIEFDCVMSVWFRRPTRFKLPPGMTHTASAFAASEARMGLGGILRSLDCLWVNHPERIISADYKPFQLKLARVCGLDIPRTLITNDPEAARRFYEECQGNVIYKTLSTGAIISKEEGLSTIYTSRLTGDDLAHLDQVRNTACLFQEYIAKACELRITVVGQQVFCAEIHSQHSERSATDWRQGYSDLTYAVHDIPSDVRSQCLALTRQLGLEYAAIDMICTPESRYIFLELNSNGQWGWIQSATGLPICEALADLLTLRNAHDT